MVVVVVMMMMMLLLNLHLSARVHAEAVRVERARKHGDHAAEFRVNHWVHKGMGVQWSPRRRGRVLQAANRRRVQDRSPAATAQIPSEHVWEEKAMRTADSDGAWSAAAAAAAAAEAEDRLRRREVTEWATPSPLTISGVHPMVVHIPETQTERRVAGKNAASSSSSSSYSRRVEAIARDMGCIWLGPVSPMALPQHHVLHAIPAHQNSTPYTQDSPPQHPNGPHARDHGVDARSAADDDDDDNNNNNRRSKGGFSGGGGTPREWYREWRRWARDVTNPAPPRSSSSESVGDGGGGDGKTERGERSAAAGGDHGNGRSPWQTRLRWARAARGAWLARSDVTAVYLQRPLMRTLRSQQSQEDDDGLPPNVSVSDARPALTLPRDPTMWTHYRENPTIRVPDDRPGVRLRDEMDEAARRRTRDWRASSPSVGDPLLTQQWNLYDAHAWGDVPPGPAVHRPSMSGGPRCWDLLGVNGSGVVIGLVDSGIEVSHPELRDRYVRALSVDALNAHRRGDPIPVDPAREIHGTQAAGVALATRGNGVCGVGVAPGASLAVMRLLGLRSPTDHEEARALTHRCADVHISSNSWGPTDDGSGLHGPGVLASAGMDACVDGGHGRHGLGTIYVWAAGNGRTHGDNINFDGYANRPKAIAVGALDDRGRQAWYSEAGACLMTVMPSSGSNMGIITSDPTGRNGLSKGSCTDSFGGTSASAPSAAGIIAMMLQTRPDLGWRDVQHIVVRSSQPLQQWTHRQRWSRNGAGYWHSHGYGFGLLNASLAVEMARRWTKVPTTPSPDYVSHSEGETLSAASTWRIGGTQERYMEKMVQTEEQREVDRFFSDREEKHRKAEEHRKRKEARRARRLAKASAAWRTLHWIGQRAMSIAYGVWTSAVSQVIERSERDAEARRKAWKSDEPFWVRVVNDRHGSPTGVAIPPGMGANFTWPDGWWMNREQAHQSGGGAGDDGGTTNNRKAAIAYLEHVGLRIYVNTPAGRGRLRIRLFSPKGTESIMAEGTAVNDDHLGIDGRRWIFWTVRCWGESSALPSSSSDADDGAFAGQWRLEVWHMEPGQTNPERDAEMRAKGKPRETTAEAHDTWKRRIHRPHQVDAVVRWWQLVGRGTQR